MTLYTVILYKPSNSNGGKKHLPVQGSLPKPPSDYKTKVSTANKTEKERGGGGVFLKKSDMGKCWPRVHACLCELPECVKNPEAPRDMRWEERQGVSHAAHSETRVVHPHRELDGAQCRETDEIRRETCPIKAKRFFNGKKRLTQGTNHVTETVIVMKQNYLHHIELGLHRQTQKNKTHISNCWQTRTITSHIYTYVLHTRSHISVSSHTRNHAHLASQNLLRSPARSWFLLLLNQT